MTGPNFGSDALLDTIADTPALATFMGEHTRLIWHRDNPHPALATLRTYLAATTAGQEAAGTWAPGWVIPR